MKSFLNEDFLLQSPTAQQLYHGYAAKMPIIDYHNHLPPDEIATNKTFKTITEVWLKGDHYKWRAMRANGVAERYCTGDASDWEKFEAWAKTVPRTVRNPQRPKPATDEQLRMFDEEAKLGLGNIKSRIEAGQTAPAVAV